MQRTLQLHQHVPGEQNAKGPPSQSYRYQLLRTTGTYIEHAVPDSTPWAAPLRFETFGGKVAFYLVRTQLRVYLVCPKRYALANSL